MILKTHLRKIILVTGLLLLVPVVGVQAFPGDAADESCQALVEQALADAEASGTQAQQPDCLLNMGLSAMEMRAAEAETVHSPVPNVRPIEVRDEVVNASRFRRLYEGATIYDAPNGNPLRQVGGGLTLVSYIGWIEGWVQLRQNEWVRQEDTRTYEVSSFGGVEIDAPLERPFAWMLAPVQPSLYPGGPPHDAYEEIERYAMMNIYGVEIVDGWEWYMVGRDQWIQQIRVSKVKPVERPAEVGDTDIWLAVDLFEQTLVAYEGDRMVFATLISSGLPQWSTNEGLFQIYQRWTRGPMSGAAGYLGDAYYIENIADIMYYDGDIALHAAYWHDAFGYRQSRGCVNLSLTDADWVYEWTRQDEDAWVYVYSSDNYRSDLPGWAIRPR
ncbi:MAG: L,D-transpeptidase [Anaerolineales bacterium]